MKSSLGGKYLERINQDLFQNLEILVRFINTHRLEKGSGYKQWYKEKRETGIEVPTRPPEIKQRLYDFFSVYCPEALDFGHLPILGPKPQSISSFLRAQDPHENFNTYSDYEAWLNSENYEGFKYEIYDLFELYVEKLIQDPIIGSLDLLRAAHYWFNNVGRYLIPGPQRIMKLLQISSYSENDDMSYTELQVATFEIRIDNLLHLLCQGLYSAVILQLKQSSIIELQTLKADEEERDKKDLTYEELLKRKKQDPEVWEIIQELHPSFTKIESTEKENSGNNQKRENIPDRETIPVLKICLANQPIKNVRKKVVCNQVIASKIHNDGRPRDYCSDSCRRRSREQRDSVRTTKR